MTIPVFQVDAFAERPFEGNPAAVCLLESWLDDELLQSIAAENNLSETAFLVRRGSDFDLRWFTPAAEVPLCGHATLAAGWVVLDRLEPALDSVRFHTASGVLTVAREGGRFGLDLPSLPACPSTLSLDLDGLLPSPAEVVLTSERMTFAVFADEREVRAFVPRTEAILALERPYLLLSAPGEATDFVSRFFAPAVGVLEDPVTGSAHATLAPYWAGRLGRDHLVGRQVSPRGGTVRCIARGDRVLISGGCVPFLEGRITLAP